MSVVTVTGTEIRFLESDPVQVRLIVDADLPTPCHAPVWTVDDDGSTISVLLQASIDADQICVDVIEEVELQIDLGSFPTGSSRSVELNGETVGEFDL